MVKVVGPAQIVVELITPEYGVSAGKLVCYMKRIGYWAVDGFPAKRSKEHEKSGSC